MATMPTADVTRRSLPGSSRAPFSYDVVIPTHGKDLHLLDETIRSVELQTLPANRIVVVVDANEQAAEALRVSHPQVRVELLPERSGASGARQVGIEACEADWVAFVDDDDLWTATKQQRTAEYLAAHPECRAVRAGYWVFTCESGGAADGINGQMVEIRGDSLEELEAGSVNAACLNSLDYLDIEGDSLELLLEFNRGVIGTSVVRRDVLTGIPAVPANQRPGDDHLLFIHVAAVTEWHLIRQRLAFYRLHPGQDTRLPDPAGARGALLAKRRAWDTYAHQVRRPLTSYGPVYSAEVRQMCWSLAKRGLLGEAVRTYGFALPLMPRFTDRAIAAVPEPVIWHWNRLLDRFRRDQTSVGRTPPTW